MQRGDKQASDAQSEIVIRRSKLIDVADGKSRK
jgi:hypothetical protein